MRRSLHVLFLLTLLVGVLHAAGPAHAHEELDHHHAVADAHADGHHDKGDRDAGTVAHAAHHHCQMAMVARPGPDAESLPVGGQVLFARPVAALKSHSRAPPVEPPLA